MAEEYKNMIRCPNCGKEIDAASDFCPECIETLPVSRINMSSATGVEHTKETDTPGDDEEKVRKAFRQMRNKMGKWMWAGLGFIGLGMLLKRFFGGGIITYGLFITGIILVFIGGFYGYSNKSYLCPHCGRRPVPRMRFDNKCPRCGKRMW